MINIIPLGDHCAPSMILNELGLRKKSYPFDWYSCYTASPSISNIEFNIDLLLELLAHKNVNFIIKKLLDNKINDNNKIINDMFFPHDNGNIDEINEKYSRRFERLYNDITNKQLNLFIIITRCHTVEPKKLSELSESIKKYNENNKILLISGIDHSEILTNLNLTNIDYKYIYYDPNKIWDEDYNSFRPNIKNFLEEYVKIF